MPRKARIDAPGALHHIIVRGIERRKIFYDNADRDHYPYCGHSVLLDRKSQLEAEGYNFNWLVGQVARQLEIEPKIVLAAGKYNQSVRARSLLCYWGTRELGMTTVDLTGRLNLAQPTVSQAVIRGQKIAEDQGLSLIEKSIQ